MPTLWIKIIIWAEYTVWDQTQGIDLCLIAYLEQNPIQGLRSLMLHRRDLLVPVCL